MSREKSEAEKAAGKLISAIQKEWIAEIGESTAEKCEYIMGLAHELLQARNATAMRNILGDKSLRQFLGQEWIQTHKRVEPSINALEQAITHEGA